MRDRVQAFARRLYWPLVAVLLAGVLLRLWAILAFQPAILNSYDTTSYFFFARTQMFSDVLHPAGYMLFLRALHLLSHNLAFTIFVQHVLGLTTAMVFYLAARWVGATRGVALVPAAVICLNADQVFLEHIPMSEVPFTLLLAVSIAAVFWALRRERAGTAGKPDLLMLAAAGIALGVSVWLRTVSEVLIAVVGAWIAIAWGGSWRRRIGRGALFAAAGLAMVLVYMTAHAIYAGSFSSGAPLGWTLYGRVAPIADCRQFTPPKGTAGLCETTPSDSRPAGNFYTRTAASPAYKLFGPEPAHDDRVGAWARQVIIHQPLTYAGAVFNDFMRNFAPDYGTRRALDGSGQDELRFDNRQPQVEEGNIRVGDQWYDPIHLHVSRSVVDLSNYQSVFRTQGILVLLSLLLSIVAIALRRGPLRAPTALLFLIGLSLLALPDITIGYTYRYEVPPAGFLAAAGAMAVYMLAAGRASRPEPGPERAEPSTEPSPATV